MHVKFVLLVGLLLFSLFTTAAAQTTGLVRWGDFRIDYRDFDRPLVKAVSGNDHDVALRRDGTVVAWAQNMYGQCDVPADLENVIHVTAGSQHSLALSPMARWWPGK